MVTSRPAPGYGPGRARRRYRPGERGRAVPFRPVVSTAASILARGSRASGRRWPCWTSPTGRRQVHQAKRARPEASPPVGSCGPSHGAPATALMSSRVGPGRGPGTDGGAVRAPSVVCRIRSPLVAALPCSSPAPSAARGQLQPRNSMVASFAMMVLAVPPRGCARGFPGRLAGRCTGDVAARPGGVPRLHVIVLSHGRPAHTLPPGHQQPQRGPRPTLIARVPARPSAGSARWLTVRSASLPLQRGGPSTVRR